ncbi:MAG: proline dehydrogenase family protein [Ignavibacteriales bacterium]|nr:proline dehydrogenase family protein [Ignavibacteriales bacterium]
MSLLNTIVVKSLPLVPKSIVGQVSKRYIAGESLDDAVRTVRALNTNGFLATVDLLGEDIKEASEAIQTKTAVLRMLGAITEERLTSNVSIKPTQLGLRIDRELCYENIKALVSYAKSKENFVRIDMEDSTTTDDTLAIYYRLREEGFKNVGVVLQAYMKRTETDCRELLRVGANIRLCKGIYNEPPAVAFKDREEIRKNFMKSLRILLEGGAYVGIATHDDVLVNHAYGLVKDLKLQPAQYEFQMLLGVTENLRASVVQNNHRLRVYVPFGEQWYPYSTRRLKENPHMAGYIFKAMFTSS